MKSYFFLELDSTSPFITIIAPNSAIPESVIEVVVTSNKDIGAIKEIYTLDRRGVEKKFTFYQDSSRTLRGYIDLRDFPLGHTTIQARIGDEMDNLSNIALHIIDVSYNENISTCVLSSKEEVILLTTKSAEVSLSVKEEVLSLTVK